MKKVKMTEKSFREFVRKTISDISKEKANPYGKMSDEDLVALFVKKQMKEMTDTGGLAVKDASISAPPSVGAVNDDMTNTTIDGGALEGEDNTEDINLDESIKVVSAIIKEVNDKDLTFEKCIKIAESIGKRIPKKYYGVLKNTFEKKMVSVIKESTIKDEYQRFIF